MKICFSTLGCPEWSWEDIVATAKDFGYDGVEVRGIENVLSVPQAKPFSPQEIQKTKKHLTDIGISIPILTSDCDLHVANDPTTIMNEISDYIALAVKIGTPYVRVLGDRHPQASGDVDLTLVASRLKEVGQLAQKAGITALVETNGVFANSDTLLKLLNLSGTEGLGVLWDIHHPYRFYGEAMAETYQALKPYIKHVHIKDSYIKEGIIKYCMMGEGDLPIIDCLTLLKNDDFDGFISLEWLKRWYDDLEDAGIVFKQFIDYIRESLQKI